MATAYACTDETYDNNFEEYQPNRDELQAIYDNELHRFEQEVPMTPSEKRALRKWVASGHSVQESPGSRYICDFGMDFLTVYRADHEISAAVQGMSQAQKEAYIKDYTGYTDPSPAEIERRDAIGQTPAYVSRRYEQMAHQLSALWDFLTEKGMYSEAEKFLEEHLDDEPPLPFSFILD